MRERRLLGQRGARLGEADGEELHALGAGLKPVLEATEQYDSVLGVQRLSAFTKHRARAFEDHQHLVVIMTVRRHHIVGWELRILRMKATLSTREELPACSLALGFFNE